MEEPSVHRDRLSGLPLSLIHHILSFLRMRDVVSTTLLSKRWVDLWTTVPCLNFCETKQRDEDDGTDDDDNRIRRERSWIQNFVNRALILWNGVRILKFKIDIKSSYDSSSLFSVSDVNAWTRFAVRNKVEELEIITTRECWAPQCLKSCSSLRKLSLVGCNLQFHGTPSWNRLKSLTIHQLFGSRISGDMINRILLGSPELEEFEVRLCDSYENLSIRSSSLKKLKMENHLLSNNDKGSPLRICCPSLETLKISGMICECLFSDVSSIIEASFSIYLNRFALENVDELLGETLKQVFSTLQHVEKVSLSDVCVQVLVATHKKYLHSALPSVKFLNLNLGCEFGDVIDLLGIFPNLKVLLIKHPVYRKPPDFNAVNYMEFESNLFLLELKTVEISSDFYDFSIFGCIEFLLKHAVKLERLVLRIFSWTTSCRQERLFRISEKLLTMPRSSPTAKVILKSIFFDIQI
ncbi:hypothetical protein ACS0TY_013192 [Phlomoides rotata]